MRVAELLDAAIRLYRKNFLTFVAIVALLYVPLIVISGLISLPMARAAQEMASFKPQSYQEEVLPHIPPGLGRYLLWGGIQLLVGGTLGLVANTLMTGALAWAISERYLERPVTVGAAYRAVLRRWKPLLGSSLLTLLVYLVLYIVALIPCIGWLAFLPAMAFTYTCLRFAPQAVMLEEQRAADGLRRSWYLAKPHFWRVFGLLALLWLLAMLITAGPSYLVTYSVLVFQASYVVRTLLTTVVSSLLSLLYVPIRLTGETLLYYDLRVRQEGLDLELELEELAQTSAEEPAEGASPLPVIPPTREPFLSRRDWRNLGILLGAGLGVMLLCCVAYFGFLTLMGALTAPFMERLMENLPTLTPRP